MAANNEQKKLRIAISGAGCGGLALATVISQHSDSSVFIDVFETKAEVSTLGNAIGVWKRSWQVLQDLGMEEEFRARGLALPKDGEVRGPIFRKADVGYDQPGQDFHNHIMPYGPVILPRTLLYEIFQAKLSTNPNYTLHVSRRLVSYVQHPGGVRLDFSDGTHFEADILIGCDGVHSASRTTMYREFEAADQNKTYSKEDIERFITPKFSGTVAYRSWVDLPKFKEKYPEHHGLVVPKIWCGQNKHVVSNPTVGAPRIGIAAFSSIPPNSPEFNKPYTGPWVEDVPRQEAVDCYKGWEKSLIDMLEMLDLPISKWAIHVAEPIPFCVQGRVALLGDAAHAMTPHQGVGGGQAIEDAHLLGRLLAHPKTLEILHRSSPSQSQSERVAAILQIYQDIRLKFAQNAAENSRINGLVYEFNYPEVNKPQAGETEEDALHRMGEWVGDSFKWLAEGGVYRDWDHAEERLKQL